MSSSVDLNTVCYSSTIEVHLLLPKSLNPVAISSCLTLKRRNLNFKLFDSPLPMSTAAMTMLLKPSASLPSSSRTSEACLLSCLHRIVVYELLDERTYFRLIS
ncbi:hypothetical protein Rs2_16052 [Raphanus sativus]|nr:hypothetical protein Rs2_16052 [Raphanus sativus]